MNENTLDAKGQRRLEILVDWAAATADNGLDVPDYKDLKAIARTKVVAADGVSAKLVGVWEPTISWMLQQASFGVNNPYRELPDELRHPAGLDSAGKIPQEPLNEPTSTSTPKWEHSAMKQVHDAIQRHTKPLEALRDRDANEGDTRMVVTDMLCEGLGYDKFADLTTEYMIKQHFADYGVRIDKQLVAFVEAKRIGQKLNERHLRQVLMYSLDEGVEWMVLTNGAVWQVYHLTAGLPVNVDLVFEIDLLGPASLDEKTELMFLLHRDALKRRRIESLWRHRAATGPESLLDALLSEVVLDELRREVKRRTGTATTVEALSEAIRGEIVDPKLIAKLFKTER